MSAISAMPADVAQWLGQQAPLAGIRFLTEYPAQNKAVPLRSAIVAVGTSSVSITDKFIENDDGVLERQEYCRSAAVRLRFGIHVPFSDGGDRCHDIFTLVLDMLTFASDLNLRASGCQEITAHRDTDAFVLEAWADVLADFCPAVSTGLALGSFLPKDLLCGSHISDQGIHLSPAEKEWVNAPYRVGVYTGDAVRSSSTWHNVSLGLRPRAVFVAYAEFPPVLPSNPDIYFGFAAGSNYTMGVEINAGGFRVRNYTWSTATVVLNESGRQFFYLALV